MHNLQYAYFCCVRKSELEEIIKCNMENKKVKTEKIKNLFQNALDNFDSDLKQVCKSLVKVYARPNGGYDLQIGVHIEVCGSQQMIICTIIKKIS